MIAFRVFWFSSGWNYSSAELCHVVSSDNVPLSIDRLQHADTEKKIKKEHEDRDDFKYLLLH